MPALVEIRRSPVKGLGQEVLAAATLMPGRPLPWDRYWAVTHGSSEFDEASPGWVAPRNHVIQSTNPALARITVGFDEAKGELSLDHPDLGAITIDPEIDGQRVADWVGPIAAASGPPPYRLVKAPGQAMHDFPDTHISIGNLASLRALEEMAGRRLDRIRFRMNLWIDGAAPWEEFDWVDQEITVGTARLRVTDPVKRCNATNADPETGTRTTELTKLLYNRFRHMDFGVYAQVVDGGAIAAGDPVGL